MQLVEFGERPNTKTMPLWSLIFIGLLAGSVVEHSFSSRAILAGSMSALWLVCWFVMPNLNRCGTYLHAIGCRWLLPLSIGLFFGQATDEPPPRLELSKVMGIRGDIHDIFHRDHLIHFKVRVDDNTYVHGITSTEKSLRVGASVWLSGPFDRHVDSPNFADEAQRQWWRTRGSLFVIHSTSAANVVDRLRLYLSTRLSQVAHPKSRAILRALLLGDKRLIGPDIKRTMAAVGGQHLMAVSGLHIVGFSTALYGLLLLFSSWVRLNNPQPLALLITLMFALLLLWVCKFPVGGVRAFIMLGLFCLGTLLGRGSPSINVLFFAASVMVLITPSWWQTPGFQLSFAAVFGIITRAHANSYLNRLWQASWWSSVTTAPICIYFFGGFSPLGPFANLILIPLVTAFIMPLAWFGIIIGSCWTAPLEWAAEACLFFLAVCEQLNILGCESWFPGTSAWSWVMIFCLGLWVWRIRPAFSLILCVSAIYLGCITNAPTVHVLSVGQGDATLISHRNEHALIDAGPVSFGRRLPHTLQRLGVSQIKVLVITHGHSDHYLGLENISNAYQIETIIWNGTDPMNDQLSRLQSITQSRGTHWRVVGQKAIFIGDVKLITIPPNLDRHTSENNRSIATHVEYNDHRLLLTGDLETRGEAHLLKAIEGNYLAVKGGHHGSKTSSSGLFLRRVQPRHLILSAGLNNRFGFPHKEVLQRAHEARATLWRTDRDGRISLRLSTPPLISAVKQPLQSL